MPDFSDPPPVRRFAIPRRPPDDEPDDAPGTRSIAPPLDRWSAGTDDDGDPGTVAGAGEDLFTADRARQAARAHRVRHPHRLPWGRVAKRWVPETLRESRIDPGRRGALLLTVVAAVAALVAAVGVWRDRPEPRPVQSVSLAQATDASPAAGATTARPGRTSGSLSALPAATGTASARSDAVTSSGGVVVAGGLIVVSVTGAVRRPGLVRLPAGARVADAIEKAGGATSQADLTGLNLAQKLTDGASVVVGDPVLSTASGGGSSVSGAGESGAGDKTASVPASGGKVDLNTADAAALDALPGVGPVTAASIVTWREKNGHFTSVEQLQEISGIGPAKYAALAQLVRVGT